jgi:inner membrane protein involved in colicin E2 resistance
MTDMSVSSYQNINISNINTFSDMLQAMNNSGAGYLFVGINFLVFFVLMITFASSFGWEAALLSSSFIGLILSLLFLYMGVSAYWVSGVFVGVIIVTLMLKVFTRNG